MKTCKYVKRHNLNALKQISVIRRILTKYIFYEILTISFLCFQWSLLTAMNIHTRSVSFKLCPKSLFIETHRGMCKDKSGQEWVLTLSQFSPQESAWIPRSRGKLVFVDLQSAVTGHKLQVGTDRHRCAKLVE